VEKKEEKIKNKKYWGKNLYKGKYGNSLYADQNKYVEKKD
jgi:hypothetical protein